MYISYIYLKNFSGIYSGTGRTEIEVEIPDPSTLNSKLFLLLGENGSGKSTFMSCFHPFSGTFDSRDDGFIRPALEGEKVVWIEKDEFTYIIQHFYKPNKAGGFNVKSFISKHIRDEEEGEELNENGGVKTFKSIIEELFNIQEDFFIIGKLATTTSNIVNISPAERKKFISNQLPDIKPWDLAFKAAKEKTSVTEKRIKYLSEEISKFDDRGIISDKLSNLERSLRKEQKELTSIHKKISTKEEFIKKFSEENDISTIKEIRSSIERIEEFIEEADKYLDILEKKYTYLSDVEDLEDELSSLKSESNVVENKIDNNNSNLLKNKQEILSLQQDITKKEKDLEQFDKIEESEDELSELLSERKKELKNNEKEFKSLNKNDLLSGKFLKLLPKHRGTIKATAIELNSLVTDIVTVNNDDTINDIILNGLEGGNLEELLKDYKDEECKFTDAISELNNEIIRLQVKAESAEMLNERPVKCKIDSCAFIKEALEGKEALEMIEIREKNIIKKSKKLKTCKRSIEHIEKAINAISLIEKSFDIFTESNSGKVIAELLKDNINFDCALGMFEDIIKYDLLNFTADVQVDELFNIIDIKEDISNLKITIKNIEDKIQFISNNSKFIDSIESDINIAEKKIKNLKVIEDKLDNKLLDLTLEKDNLDRKIEVFTKYKNKVEKLSKKEEELKPLKKSIKKYSKALKDLSEREEDLNELKDELALKENNKDVVENDLNNIRITLSKLDEYQEKYDNFINTYEDEKAVRNACDPKKGIPLFFIKEFLSSLEEHANMLFDLAFKGKFRIFFEVNEKEFRIPVLKENGEILSDVKKASDGEMALVKTIISLSLLSYYTNDFSILCLDEVDAVLDINHRSNFAEIIDKQIDILNLDQVLMISHNTEFRDDAINMLLFPNNDFERSNAKNEIICDFS